MGLNLGALGARVKGFATAHKKELLIGGAGVAAVIGYRSYASGKTSGAAGDSAATLDPGTSSVGAGIAGLTGDDSTGAAYDSTENDVYDALQPQLAQEQSLINKLQSTVTKLTKKLTTTDKKLNKVESKTKKKKKKKKSNARVASARTAGAVTRAPAGMRVRTAAAPRKTPIKPVNKAKQIPAATPRRRSTARRR